MADDIWLNYEITNAEAAACAPDDKYLIIADTSNSKKFKLPKSLSGKMKNVYLGEEHKTV